MVKIKETALIYCENQFGKVDGKTASGLIRRSEIYEIVGVLDSSLAGRDAGEVLTGQKNGIPIFADLQEASAALPRLPDCYIYGKAPLETFIPIEERLLILEAIERGMDIVNGLHQFFSEDREFSDRARQFGVRITDVRKPPNLEDLHIFTGRISTVNIPVIAVLGTDCACGKMTTAVELDRALNDLGIRSVLVATGQTGLLQGARYGVSIDALVSQFAIGEIESAVLNAFEGENPDIIIVEGQSSVSHPAFMSSVAILKGSTPDGVILQHPPAREFRCDFPRLAMPTVGQEIRLIEAISATTVIAIAINHENLTERETAHFIDKYERDFHLPTTDVLRYGCDRLVQALSDRFPRLKQKISRTTLKSISSLSLK
jgi:uncharacterized NAD-dependent epimerase/dehydratase family protein